MRTASSGCILQIQVDGQGGGKTTQLLPPPFLIVHLDSLQQGEKEDLAAQNLGLVLCLSNHLLAHLPRDWLELNKYAGCPFALPNPETSERQGRAIKPAACEIQNKQKQAKAIMGI